MTKIAVGTALNTIVSTKEDFPHLTVSRRPGNRGEVWSVEFANKEYGGGKQSALAFAGLVVLFLFVPGIVFLGKAAEAANVDPGWGAILIFGIFVFILMRLRYPWTIRRAIELDFGADQLRVLRGRRMVVSRPLSRLASLTVEDDPDAEFERNRRLQRGRTKLTEAEKRHCLIGWFGMNGAEQVILIKRVEYPNRNSLFEVRQAVIWAVQAKADATASAAAAQPAAAFAGGATIKPPLD